MATPAISPARPLIRHASRVAACIDASPYLESVCDHAAWAADKVGGVVQLVQAAADKLQSDNDNSGDEATAALLVRAVDRLADDGVMDVDSGGRGEGFPPADLIVRGRARGPFDLNVSGIDSVGSALLITPKLFLPIGSALIVAAPAFAAAQFAAAVQTCPWLEGLTLQRAPADAAADRLDDRGMRSDRNAGPRDLIVLSRAAIEKAAPSAVQATAQAHLRSKLPVLLL